MLTAREVALDALLLEERRGAWPDAWLHSALPGLDRREAALAARLCYGVLQNRLLLDFWISSFSSTPVQKLEPAVRNALRLGLYQIVFLEKIPDRAAVSESVELVRRHCKNPRAGGLVNAVLRAFLRSGDSLPQPGGTGHEALSVRYSHPLWLVKAFQRAGAEDLEGLLAADNDIPPTVAQVNTLKTTPAALKAALTEQGVTAEVHPWLPGCLTLSGAGDLSRLPEFQAGGFYIQDAAARLTVLAAGLKPGMRVLDACAAPGGKSFAAAIMMENRGEILSCDLHEKKLGRVRQGAARLGLTCITARAADGKQFRPEWESGFDAVLADVPCSGLGIIRKKPDIRYKAPETLTGLPAVQLELLKNVARYVRPGGVLLYSTCTLLPEENGGVIGTFLDCCPDYRPEGFALPGPVGQTAGQLTLWPHVHGTDGFYMAKLRRLA